MRKKYGYLITLLVTVLMFVGCGSNEKEGAPEQLILSSDAYYEFSAEHGSVIHNITHDINTNSHTDMVTLEMTTEESYAKQTVMLTYQYSKSDDLWTLTSSQNKYPSLELNDEALIADSPWTVKYFDKIATVHIEDIDFLNSTISLKYEIDVDGDGTIDVVQKEPVVESMDEEYDYDASFYWIIIERNGDGRMYLKLSKYGLYNE